MSSSENNWWENPDLTINGREKIGYSAERIVSHFGGIYNDADNYADDPPEVKELSTLILNWIESKGWMK